MLVYYCSLHSLNSVQMGGIWLHIPLAWNLGRASMLKPPACLPCVPWLTSVRVRCAALGLVTWC